MAVEEDWTPWLLLTFDDLNRNNLRKTEELMGKGVRGIDLRCDRDHGRDCGCCHPALHGGNGD